MAHRSKARLVDVARDAGVSPATVSRAMTQPELLSAGTLTLVQDSARKLGYRPDGMARALASGRTMAIGAIVPTLDSTIFARVLQSMQLALSREGYQLLVEAPDHSSLLALLEQWHRPTQAWLERPTSDLTYEVAPPEKAGRRYTAHWVLDRVHEHEIHHRGQLSVYLRMIGVEPPSMW